MSPRASFTSSCQPIDTAVNCGRSPTIISAALTSSVASCPWVTTTTPITGAYGMAGKAGWAGRAGWKIRSLPRPSCLAYLPCAPRLPCPPCPPCLLRMPHVPVPDDETRARAVSGKAHEELPQLVDRHVRGVDNLVGEIADGIEPGALVANALADRSIRRERMRSARLAEPPHERGMARFEKDQNRI